MNGFKYGIEFSTQCLNEEASVYVNTECFLSHLDHTRSQTYRKRHYQTVDHLTYQVWSSWSLRNSKGRQPEQERDNKVKERVSVCLVGTVPFLFLTAHACCLDMSALLPGGFAIRWAEAEGVLVGVEWGRVKELTVDINIMPDKLLTLAQLETDDTRGGQLVPGWW